MKSLAALVIALVALSLGITLGSTLSPAQSVNVTTWHNDIGRTGQNTQETTLTTSVVGNDANFGRKCTYHLLTDEWVYAQPLVVSNVLLHGQTQAKTVVYVVTMLDNIYAFDGVNVNANGSCILLLGPTPLLINNEVAANTTDIGHGQRLLGNNVGILGTPAIELTGTSPTTTGTIYAVAESESGSPPSVQFFHRIWALDITSLSPVNSGNGVQICASGCGGIPFSQNHIQRAGLLWLSSGQTGGWPTFTSFVKVGTHAAGVGNLILSSPH